MHQAWLALCAGQIGIYERITYSTLSIEDLVKSMYMYMQQAKQ